MDKSRDAWVLAFIEQANTLLREPLPKKFAWSLGLSLWVANHQRNPAEFAREWLGARPKPAAAKSVR